MGEEAFFSSCRATPTGQNRFTRPVDPFHCSRHRQISGCSGLFRSFTPARTGTMQAIEHHKFNTSEAAKYLGVGASTLSKLRVFGGGPVFLKLGRRVVYERADLDAWTQGHRRLSTSDPGSADLHADPISSDRSRSGGPPNGLPTPEIRSAEFLDSRNAADR